MEIDFGLFYNIKGLLLTVFHKNPKLFIISKGYM